MPKDGCDDVVKPLKARPPPYKLTQGAWEHARTCQFNCIATVKLQMQGVLAEECVFRTK